MSGFYVRKFSLFFTATSRTYWAQNKCDRPQWSSGHGKVSVWACVYMCHVMCAFHHNSASDLTGSGLPSRNYEVKSRRRWTPKLAKAGRSGKLLHCWKTQEICLQLSIYEWISQNLSMTCPSHISLKVKRKIKKLYLFIYNSHFESQSHFQPKFSLL